jgi:hypothetical protein
MKMLSVRPSPAMVVAVVALICAMAGTAVAGTDGLSSKINKAKVKKISKKQAKKQLKANVSGSHVNTADTATNATNAANAATAANAANADKVDGQSVIKVFSKFPNGTTNLTIGTFDGYTLRASCTAGDVENFQLISSDTQVAMTAQGNGNVGPTFAEQQGGGSTTLNLDSGGNDNARGQVTFSAAKTGGNTVSGNLGYDDPNLFNGENVCAVYGHIILNNG